MDIAAQHRIVQRYGPFAQPATGTDYLLTLFNADDWPATDDVCTVTVEISLDQGQSWQFDASVTFAGLWKDRQGNVIHQAPWRVRGTHPGITHVRVSFEMLQPATFGFSL